jgi:hypothetical protein
MRKYRILGSDHGIVGWWQSLTSTPSKISSTISNESVLRVDPLNGAA